MIKKTCEICNKIYFTKCNESRFCNRLCADNHHSQVMLGKKLSKIHKKNISKGKTGTKLSTAHIKKISERQKKRIGNKNSNWRGGKRITREGYIEIYSPNHPLVIKRNVVKEHRLVVEEQIGRYLTKKEKVHHIGKKNDNSPNMLMAFSSNSAHQRFHHSPDNVKPEEIIFDGRKIT